MIKKNEVKTTRITLYVKEYIKAWINTRCARYIQSNEINPIRLKSKTKENQNVQNLCRCYFSFLWIVLRKVTYNTIIHALDKEGPI